MKSETNTENTAGSDCQERLVSPWVDVTSFSQNCKDRKPRTWRAKFGRFDIVVTRHRDYEPDEWVCRCYGLWETKKLASKDLLEAACQAKAMLQSTLEDALQDILGANAAAHPPAENQTPTTQTND